MIEIEEEEEDFNFDFKPANGGENSNPSNKKAEEKK